MQKLLEALDGFLRDIFGFALTPFEKLVDQVTAPIMAPINKGVHDSLPDLAPDVLDTDIDVKVEDGEDEDSDMGQLLQNGFEGSVQCVFEVCQWAP